MVAYGSRVDTNAQSKDFEPVSVNRSKTRQYHTESGVMTKPLACTPGGRTKTALVFVQIQETHCESSINGNMYNKSTYYNAMTGEHFGLSNWNAWNMVPEFDLERHVHCYPCLKLEVHIACKICWHTFFCSVSLYGLYGIYPIKIQHLVSIFFWMAQKVSETYAKQK